MKNKVIRIDTEQCAPQKVWYDDDNIIIKTT